MSNYKRIYQKEKDKIQNKFLNDPDFLFNLTHKDSFNIKVENNKSRLTADRSNSLIKNKIKSKKSINHSNSMSHIRSDNLIPSLEKNYNIININVNNVIINNNNNNNNNNINNISQNSYKKINNNNNNNNNINTSKILSKAGSVIMGKQNHNISNMKSILSVPKKNKHSNEYWQNYRSSSLKLSPKIKQKYKKSPPALSSDIQGVIKDLMESSNNMNKNLNVINDTLDNQLTSDDKNLFLHMRLWESLLNIETSVDNKNGISFHIKKVLNLIEKEFSDKEKSNVEIFKNFQLNKIYSKIVKMYFILITYIKFLLTDFNYEVTIKSNIKRLLASISNILLLLLATYVPSKNLPQDLSELAKKMMKIKKIKKNSEPFSIFYINLNKNIEVSIYIIKQFSNNFFKIGYFNLIHNILFDIILLIDDYTINEVGNIIINGVLYYLLHNNKLDKKPVSTISNIISIGGGYTNPLAALGFIDVPSPYLPVLPQHSERSIYTLILDLDETLVHFIFTPSGGTFLIRPFCFKFLEDMSKLFETVIFTAGTKDYADSILDIIDPTKTLIKHRLYRHHTSICDITFVKDLNKIGRDLNRCLIIDNLADNFKLQPNNGIQISTWTDDMKDTQLYDLNIILTKIIQKNPVDIKPIIKNLNDEISRRSKNNLNTNPFKDIDINKILGNINK